MRTPDDELKIRALEQKAERILSQKEKTVTRRPIVIEFAGSPKAGKTTTISSVMTFLKRNGFRTKLITERASVCPVSDKFSPDFNVWTGASSLVGILGSLNSREEQHDIAILDRGIFDALCWFQWQRENGHLDKFQFDLFQDFFLNPYWTTKIDALLIFSVDPNASIEREYRNLLTRKTGRVMRPTVLQGLKDAIDLSREKYKNHFRNILQVDTTSKQPDAVNFEVTSLLLDSLERQIVEEIGYFPATDLMQIEESVFPISQLAGTVGIDDLAFEKREFVEAQDNLVQPIPAAIITNKERTKVLVSKKTKRAAGNKSAEYERLLFYFGGHVRAEDKNVATRDLLDVFEFCLWRELKEELDINYDISFDNTFCVWDKNNPKSKKHLAVLTVVEVDFRNFTHSKESIEFKKGDFRILDVGKLTDADIEGLEAWSAAIVEFVLRRQKEFDFST